MYLEISGRGTGKTYRAAHAISAYLLEDENNIANIVCPVLRQAEIVKEEVERKKIGLRESDYKRIRCTSFDYKNSVVRGYRNLRNFYDEFDYIKFDLKKNDPFFFGDAYKDDYYTTSPAKIRDLSQIPIEEVAKTDFLLRLLLENNAMYVSFVYGQGFLAPNFLKRIKENMDAETFQREIEGRFLKY